MVLLISSHTISTKKHPDATAVYNEFDTGTQLHIFAHKHYHKFPFHFSQKYRLNLSGSPLGI